MSYTENKKQPCRSVLRDLGSDLEVEENQWSVIKEDPTGKSTAEELQEKGGGITFSP